MSARRAPQRDDLRRKKRIAATDDPHGLADQRELQIARLAVRPIEHSLLAVDAQANVVLSAGGRLRRRERSARAAFELDQRRRVVDDLAARHQRAQVGCDAGDRAPGDETGEMLRVAADRAHHERLPAALRVEDPAQPVVLRALLDARREPALDVLDLDEPDRAQRAVVDEHPRVARHRIRRIRVRDGEQAVAATRSRDEIAGLGEGLGDRLVADDVETGVERRNRERVVRVVRRHDRDRLDAVRALALPFEHLVDAAVAAGRIESHRRPRGARACRIAGKHAGDRLPPAVHLGGAPMHAADPGVRPSADDREAKRSPELFA